MITSLAKMAKNKESLSANKGTIILGMIFFLMGASFFYFIIYKKIIRPILVRLSIIDESKAEEKELNKDLKKDIEKEINTSGNQPMKYNQVLTPADITADAKKIAKLFSTDSAIGAFGIVVQAEEVAAVNVVKGYGVFAFQLLEKAYESTTITSAYVGTGRGLKADFIAFVDKYTLEPIQILINS